MLQDVCLDVGNHSVQVAGLPEWEYKYKYKIVVMDVDEDSDDEVYA